MVRDHFPFSVGFVSRLLPSGLVFFLILAAVPEPRFAQTAEDASEWAGAYNSEDAGLEEPLDTGRRKQVYTLQNIETLRRAVRPRYVRVLNPRHYASGDSGYRSYLQKGILFTYASYRSRRVFLSGDFSNWGNIPMRRNEMGVFYHILPVRELEAGRIIEAYRYKFLVDGIWTADPTHPNTEDDGLGGSLSVYYLDDIDVNRLATVRVLKEREPSFERLVEFAIYLPDAENLSLVGEFNNWNPEHDFMTKGEDGVFRLRMRLRPGGYVYKFVADGKWILDKYNEETRYHEILGELCSFLEIE